LARYHKPNLGGTGDSKIGGNYAPGILPQLEVADKGYQQVLWLFGEDHHITEVGTMNLFVLWKNEKGETELITPPLDGTILPGVTRDSVLSLCKEWKMEVNERKLTMADLVKASKEKRIIEMFGSGTAAIVSPVKCVHYEGTDYKIPLDPRKPDSQAGPLTTKLAETIMGIQYGEIPHPWSVKI
jgi:branched-chain amino acid aminotransferase